MITKQILVPIEKAADPATADGAWYIATKNPDLVGDTIAVEALRANEGRRIPALFGHKKDQIIGYWEIRKEKAGKLPADLSLSRVELGQHLKTLLEDGVPISASIGLIGKGPKNAHGGIHFKELHIFETSLVAVPCNMEAIRIKGLELGIDLEPLLFTDAPGHLPTRAQRAHLLRAAAAIAKAKHLTNGAMR